MNHSSYLVLLVNIVARRRCESTSGRFMTNNPIHINCTPHRSPMMVYT